MSEALPSVRADHSCHPVLFQEHKISACDIQNNNFASCFVWLCNEVSYVIYTGEYTQVAQLVFIFVIEYVYRYMFRISKCSCRHVFRRMFVYEERSGMHQLKIKWAVTL